MYSKSQTLRRAAVACALTLSARPRPARPRRQNRRAGSFKNIQALQGTPADQVLPAMQFIAASLGVECEFCHVEHKFEADDKPAKATARKMIAMTLAINKDSFNGRKEVTCYYLPSRQPRPRGNAAGPHQRCGTRARRSRSRPLPLPRRQPPIRSLRNTSRRWAERKRSTRSPAAYRRATSASMGHEIPIEVFAKAPDKRMSVTHMGIGDSITAFDGQGGWLGNTGRPARDMSGQEAEAARLDADFYFATHIKEIFTGFRVGRPDKIGDHPAYGLICMRQGSRR
jgi:photosynthetic reaction center cytochrome c subunit